MRSASTPRRIGKTVPQLNAQERQIAVLNAVLREGDKFINADGPIEHDGVRAHELRCLRRSRMLVRRSANWPCRAAFLNRIGGMGDFFRDFR